MPLAVVPAWLWVAAPLVLAAAVAAAVLPARRALMVDPLQISARQQLRFAKLGIRRAWAISAERYAFPFRMTVHDYTQIN
jgi:hypothetical protein